LNSTDIRETCKQLIDEATAIIKYTDSIDAAESDALKAVFTETRHDELAHVQKLTVALTALLNGEEPEAAAQMDDAEPKPPSAEDNAQPPPDGMNDKGGDDDG
jgi:rubrerythrin